MLMYKMMVYPYPTEEGIEYVAEYPALKYVGGGGDSVEAAIEDLKINATAHIEALIEAGFPVPDSDIFEETEEFSGKVLLRVSKTLHKWMTHRAHEEGISLNLYMTEALSAYTHMNPSKKEIKNLKNLDVHE